MIEPDKDINDEDTVLFKPWIRWTLLGLGFLGAVLAGAGQGFSFAEELRALLGGIFG